MYLSRMFLNPRRRQARNLIANPEMMHAAVMSAFPPSTSKELWDGSGRVLWRLDEETKGTALYIVSPTKPSFSHLQEQAGWENQKSWVIRPYDSVVDNLWVGKQFAFRLAANPVKSVRDPETGKQRRLAHVTAAQQCQWLLDRAEDIGIKFPNTFGGSDAVTVTNRQILRFKRKGRPVTIARAQYDGALEVVNSERFRKALVQGIGKAKGYGCGLMTVAPAQFSEGQE